MAKNFFKFRKGIGLPGLSADPSDAEDSDIWYNSTLNKFRKKENGVISDLDESDLLFQVGTDVVLESPTNVQINIDSDNTQTDRTFTVSTNQSGVAGGTDLLTLTEAGAMTVLGAITGSNISGSNTGDQTITLTGEVTGSGTGSFAATIASNVIVDDNINSTAAIALNKLAATTVSRALVSDASGFITASAVTSIEVGHLDGVTSSIQTQLDGKEPTLTKGNLTEVTSSVLTIVGGTGSVIGSGASIEVDQADTSNDGYLSSTDWNIFNNKTSFDFTASNDNRLLRSDTVGGSELQESGIIIDDSDNVSGMGTLGVGAITSSGAITGSNLSGTNTGDQTITLTGVITGSGTGSFATSFGSGAFAALDVNTTSGNIGSGGTSSLAKVFSTNTGLTTTNQIGYYTVFTGNGNATATVRGILSDTALGSSGITTGKVVALEGGVQVGATSTATRGIILDMSRGVVGGAGTTTNSAYIADNDSFTGHHFIHSTSTESSLLTGVLGIGSIPGGESVLDITKSDLTGTDQRAIQVSWTSTSAATGSTRGFMSNIGTAAASYTSAQAINYVANAITKGAGSTITRALSFFGAQQTVGTNNAVLTDNVSFTGDYTFHTSGTNPSNHGGPLVVGTSNGFTGTSYLIRATSSGTNPLTGTEQIGVFADPQFTSASTVSMTGYRAQVQTANASYTTTNVHGIEITDFVKGASHTITRGIGLLVTPPTVATNNAAIADNESFTGDYFIHQNGTLDNKLDGTVIVLSNLPTSDPSNTGQLWNDSGTLKVS